VWDKRPAAWNEGSEGIDDVIGSGFELLWSAKKHQQRVLRQQWSGFTARNPGVERAHPTEKPVSLLVDILERWSPKGCAVADPFAGSGTTLLAAARSGRSGFGVELDPAYVDVIVARLERETGETAVRVDG
jgi:DNA modification methylase